MNALKSHISESLLDMDNVDNSNALIEEFLKENYKIEGSYTITDGVVDVKGNVKIINKNITQLTNGLFRFGEVSGDFNCICCDLLVSLEGAPNRVGFSFSCSNCKKLKTLEGAPQEVGEDFYCNYCSSLVSLNGVPRKIGRGLYYAFCDSLVILHEAPRDIGENLYYGCCNKEFSNEGVIVS